MNVLQLIDSLHAGGAERMAVNLANSLVTVVTHSYLCATREEGLLKGSLDAKVNYLFLKKTSRLDFGAILRLHKFINAENISIIHAHSSSFFLATLIKLLNPKVRLIWHDHYGNSEMLNQRPKRVLQLCSYYFSHIISVNLKLKAWAENTLKAKTVSYLSNFAISNSSKAITALKGVDGKRIVCLANLRPQKDIINAIEAFSIVLQQHPDWTLHLVGKNFNDDYSQLVIDCIETLQLKQQVFLYGSVPDSLNVLRQSSIGVLASQSEGLPVALLEYGLASLPVVVTNVGDCAEVILNGKLGQLVPAKHSTLLAEALQDLINNPDKAKQLATAFNTHVLAHYTDASTVKQLQTIYTLSLQ